jgi:hypothetical protein
MKHQQRNLTDVLRSLIELKAFSAAHNKKGTPLASLFT